MKKLVTLAAVAAALVLGSLALLLPTAQAADSQYPDALFDLTVDRDTVYGGEHFTAVASSTVDCSWRLEWNGDVHTGTGTEYITRFTAPEVTKVTRITLHGDCAYAAGNSARMGHAVALRVAHWKKNIVITVLPRGNAVAAPFRTASSASLPNTGGPNVVALLGGALLVAVGATAVTVARRHADDI